jgi:hypothetical protein
MDDSYQFNNSNDNKISIPYEKTIDLMKMLTYQYNPVHKL